MLEICSVRSGVLGTIAPAINLSPAATRNSPRPLAIHVRSRVFAVPANNPFVMTTFTKAAIGKRSAKTATRNNQFIIFGLHEFAPAANNPFRTTTFSNPMLQPLWNDNVYKKVGGWGVFRKSHCQARAASIPGGLQQ